MQSDLFLPRAVEMMLQNHDRFPKEFIEWLPSNLHVFGAFEREALAAKRRGFEHYSGRTIMEFLRHHSAVKETAPGSEWKLNNDHVPYLTRLFDLVRPEAAGMFEYRKSKKVFTPSEQRTSHDYYPNV